MRYIAALDYEHLDNGVFLTSLANSISQQKDTRSIIVHADSAYTERVMQTGVMREDARTRSIKDLNHRLVAMFADQGVSVIGINGYQRKFITRQNGELNIDQSFYEGLPSEPVLLISTLVWDTETESPAAVPLTDMALFLKSQLQADRLFAFTLSDKSEILTDKPSTDITWNSLPDGFSKEHLPEEFREFNHSLHLSTARDFHDPSGNEHSVFIT